MPEKVLLVDIWDFALVDSVMLYAIVISQSPSLSYAVLL